LAAKRLAAQLAQADLSPDKYGRLANYDFGKIVREILDSDEDENNDRGENHVNVALSGSAAKMCQRRLAASTRAS
jgi:hypothetical protein